MAKTAVKSIFSLDPSLWFLPQNRPFSSDSATFGAKTTFFGVFFSSVREKFSPEISFCAEKISLTRYFSDLSTRNSTFADVEKRKAGVFSPNNRRSNIKMKKEGCRNKKVKNEKQKDIMEKTKHNRARQIVFLSLPHSVRKIQADFLSKRPHFSRLPPLFHLKPPYPAQNPFHSTRRTRAYAYVRACALSEFIIFAFTLHLTPQQTVDQSLECEGKPCIHLHLHRNNLKNNMLHDIHCKKSVKLKGWSLHT